MLPLMLTAQAVVMLNVQEVKDVNIIGWSMDWSFMLSVWNAGTMLLSPVAAAFVVLLMQRAWKPPSGELVAALARAGRSRLDIMAAVLVQGLAVQLVALSVASSICWTQDAESSGATLPWQLLTGPAALIAAVTLGGLIGEYWKDPWAIPVTAIGVFLSLRVFFWKGYPELLVTQMATSPVTGYKPIPQHLMATCASNLCLAFACSCLVLWRVRVRRFRSHWLIVLALIALLAIVAIFYPFVASQALNTYEPI